MTEVEEPGFFTSRWVDPPAGVEVLGPDLLADGFAAGGSACGLKGGEEPDLGIVACREGSVSSAILLTRNALAAAPVRVCRERLRQDSIAAVIANSGNANAATGERGLRDAMEIRDEAARELGLDADRVAIAQTGVIGVPVDLEAVLPAIAPLCGGLDRDGGGDFARSIMTTDRSPKACTVAVDGVTVSAQAKGAGMIEPGFATMLCFVQTDAVVEDPMAALGNAVGESFERISVDGQMSTNDTVLLQANGLSGFPLPDGLLDAVLLQLAIEIVADGEGATRVARLEVTGAADPEEADRAARAVANSPLVKTALLGRDPNWGRIGQAVGAALAGEHLPDLDGDRIEASELAGAGDEVDLAVRLDRGDASSHVYFPDLTHKYIEINAEYTT